MDLTLEQSKHTLGWKDKKSDRSEIRRGGYLSERSTDLADIMAEDIHSQTRLKTLSLISGWLKNHYCLSVVTGESQTMRIENIFQSEGDLPGTRGNSATRQQTLIHHCSTQFLVGNLLYCRIRLFLPISFSLFEFSKRHSMIQRG